MVNFLVKKRGIHTDQVLWFKFLNFNRSCTGDIGETKAIKKRCLIRFETICWKYGALKTFNVQSQPRYNIRAECLTCLQYLEISLRRNYLPVPWIQYCAKVMQTIIVVYCVLFFRYIAEYRWYIVHFLDTLRTINRRGMGALLRCLVPTINRSNDTSFPRYIAKTIYRKANIQWQRSQQIHRNWIV